MSVTKNLGRVTFVRRGAYDASATYNKLDIVRYNGSDWCALQTVKGVSPVSGAYWMSIAEKGDKGEKGATGDYITVDNVSPSNKNVTLDAVKYTAQTNTEAQRTEVRTYMDAQKTLTIDDELDDDSTNIVENQAITNYTDADTSILDTKAPEMADSIIEAMDIVSITDGADNIPVRALSSTIVPVQEGSGDPSPDNVRPISGWDGANVTRTGKNLFDGEFVNMAIVTSGSPIIRANNTYRGFYVRVFGGMKFTVSRKEIETNRFRIGATVNIPVDYEPCVTLSNSSTNDSKYSLTVTVPQGYNYLFVYLSNQSDTCTANNYQVEIGSTATSYEPYQGVTLTADFGQTVYGGVIDWVEGKVTVTDANIASYNGETLPSTWISDRDVYSVGATPTTGAQVVYKLATPTTINLTPQELRTLYQNNNLWSDAGQITNFVYIADTKLYIDNKFAALMAIASET